MATANEDESEWGGRGGHLRPNCESRALPKRSLADSNARSNCPLAWPRSSARQWLKRGETVKASERGPSTCPKICDGAMAWGKRWESATTSQSEPSVRSCRIARLALRLGADPTKTTQKRRLSTGITHEACEDVSATRRAHRASAGVGRARPLE